MRQARNNPALEGAALTRHLNIWIGADEALFSTRDWMHAADRNLRIEDYEGHDCHLALDLASRTDLAALVAVFPEMREGELHYVVFCRCYLNAAAVMEARNASYPGWAAENSLIVTEGNETDFQTIEDDTLEWFRRFHVLSMAFDPWRTTQLAQRLESERVPVKEFRSTTQNFSAPTRELEAAIRSGRVHHDGNGPLAWCIANVVGHVDARDNVYPRKARPENKIDAAVALIMAIGRVMENVSTTSIYETRGLMTLG
jgi:phage terminase large subunit-like protein